MLQLLLLFVAAHATVATALRQPTADIVVFRAGQHGYQTYRIPGFVRATNGSLIALAEGRVRINGPQVPCHGWRNNTCCYGKPASDFDGLCYDKDIVLKTSRDGGRSWGSLQILTQSNASHYYSNAIGVTDATTGRVWVLFSRCSVARGYSGCTDRWVYSDTHGESWSAAPEADAQEHGSGLSGVGSGIQLRSPGPHHNRLLFAKGRAVFSDDDGRHWTAATSTFGSSEGQIAELAGGSLLAAVRSGWQPGLRRSTDGGEHWSTGYQLDGTGGHSNVTTDNCALSMISVSPALEYVLLSHPNRPDIGPADDIRAGQPIGRQNATVSIARVGTGGHLGTFVDYVQIYAGPSAYTSLGQMADGECGVLYERSAVGALPVHFDSLNYATFPCAPLGI